MTRVGSFLAGFTLLIAAQGGVAAQELADELLAARPRLAESPFGRPLLLESIESDGRVRGTILALVDRPIEALLEGLDTPSEWCEVMILHLNVRFCEASRAGTARSLAVLIGRKGAEEGDGSHALDLEFQNQGATAPQLSVMMTAAEGPMGTRDYRLSLDAIPVGRKQSFVRLTYAYEYGTAARIAMSTYLETLGRRKVGFSRTTTSAPGEIQYVGGLRGVLERNTMRYYLAIETYLASADQPVATRPGWRFRTWFDETERYSRQLHEISKRDYLAGKQTNLGSRVSDPKFVLSEASPG
jgi:hypothetical protein